MEPNGIPSNGNGRAGEWGELPDTQAHEDNAHRHPSYEADRNDCFEAHDVCLICG